MKYRKKPVEIDAIIFSRNNWEEIVEFTNGNARSMITPRCPDGKSTCVVGTLEGPHTATEGDFIIKGIKGEFYPCKPDIFAMTYEQVEV